MTELELPKTTSTDLKPTGWPFSNVAAIAMLILVAGVYGPAFSAGHGMILSQSEMDLVTVNVPWYTFLSQELRAHRFPLWSPHFFCGSPYLGDLFSGVLYPINWLLVVLPVDLFIDLSIVIHVYLAGWFMALWCRQRGISGIGSILAGAISMLGGVTILHIDAGHVQIIAACAWMPLIFLSIDKLFDDGRFRWVLLGTAAVGLSILAGFAQLVYFVALMAGLYTLLRMLPIAWAALVASDAPRIKAGGGPWVRIIRAGVFGLAVYAGGASLSAASLLPAIDTSRQSVRSNGLSYYMASACPQPPEMFLSLIDPRFWGDYTSDGTAPNPPTFFARWYPWEVSSYVGVGAIVLAAFGACFGRQQSRRCMAVLAILCVILALGKHTPLYKLMYDHLPMYSSFRSANRWNILLTFFVAVLAGAGLDALLRIGPRRYWFAGLVLLVAGALFLGVFWIRNELALPNAGNWGNIIRYLADSNEVLFIPHVKLTSDAFIHDAGMFASGTLVLPAACMAGAAVLMIVSWYWKPAAYGLLVMSLAELCVYTTCNRYTTSMSIPFSDAWKQAIANLGPDGRVLSSALNYANVGMELGYDDAYGYDPVVLKRYAEFLAAIQTDADPSLALRVQSGLNWIAPVVVQAQRSSTDPNKIVGFLVSSRLWLLRVKYVFAQLGQTQLSIVPGGANVPVMPRAKLISNYDVKIGRDDVLADLTSPQFDALHTVILEQKPDIEPDPAAPSGQVTVTDVDPDHVDVKAVLTAPQILLISDSYASGWRARSLDPLPPQDHYDVLPADYTFRAIPLREGTHHFILEYAPRSFAIGRAVSAVTLGFWLAGVGLVFWKREKPIIIRRGDAPPAEPSEPYGGGMTPAVGGETSLVLAEGPPDESTGPSLGQSPHRSDSESIVLPEPAVSDEIPSDAMATGDSVEDHLSRDDVEADQPGDLGADYQFVSAAMEITTDSPLVVPQGEDGAASALPSRPLTPLESEAPIEPETLREPVTARIWPEPPVVPPEPAPPADIAEASAAASVMPPPPAPSAAPGVARASPSAAPTSAPTPASPAPAVAPAAPTPVAPQKTKPQTPPAQKWANIPRFEGFGTRPSPKRKPPAPPPDPKSGGA